MVAPQQIRCRTIIEVLGKPKEHVEKAIKEYVDKINDDPNLIILNKDFSETKEQEKLWSTFVELELIIKGFSHLIDFCFNYMPSSIEILKPEEFSLASRDIVNLLNDLQARLHHVDMVVKRKNSENDFLKRNMHNAFKNVIFIALARNPMDKETLSKITGISLEELEIFLNKLIEEKAIKKEDNIYSIGKDAEAKKQD